MIKEIICNNRNLTIAITIFFVIFLYGLIGYSMIKL